MENTIMTEKIARRGIKTPDAYEPDILSKLTVGQMLNDKGTIISEESTIKEVREWLYHERDTSNYFIISTNTGEYKGILSISNLQNAHHNENEPIGSLIKRKPIYIHISNTLLDAVQAMAKENIDVLPVITPENNVIIGLLTYKDILASYNYKFKETENIQSEISLKRNGMKILVRGQKLVTLISRKK